MNVDGHDTESGTAMRRMGWISGWVLIVAVILALPLRAQADLESYAVVRDDASLLIRGRVVHLHGVYVPDDRQFCRSVLVPARCGSRAAVALKNKITRFVRCELVGEYADGSHSGICWTNYTKFTYGEDLGAWLIAQGFALAGPDAPFEYVALERMALANGRGVWGFQADSFLLRRR